MSDDGCLSPSAPALLVTAPWNSDAFRFQQRQICLHVGSSFPNLADRGALNSGIEGWRALWAFTPELKSEQGRRLCVCVYACVWGEGSFENLL